MARCLFVHLTTPTSYFIFHAIYFYFQRFLVAIRKNYKISIKRYVYLENIHFVVMNPK